MDHPFSTPHMTENSGWFQVEILRTLEESIRIQSFKDDNTHPMLGISPLYREGIQKDVDIVSFMYYNIPNTDSEQLNLPLSPFSKFYTKFAPLHPEDGPQMIIWTERERPKTFYDNNSLPLKEVWSRKRITKISGFGEF